MPDVALIGALSSRSVTLIIWPTIMAIDTVEQVEVIPGKGKICFYLDDTARSLEAQFPPARIEGPEGLTGEERIDRAVWLLLLAAKNTATYWGFDYEGYRRLVEYFARPDYDEKAGKTKAPEMDRATRASINDLIRTEKDLALLVEDGWLRAESYKSPEGRISAYFVTAKLARNAMVAHGVTATREASPPMLSKPCAQSAPSPQGTPKSRVVVRSERSYVKVRRLKPLF